MSSMPGRTRWTSTSSSGSRGMRHPLGGYVVHTYARGIVIELKVGDLRGRGSDRGLSDRGRKQLSFGR